MRLDHDHPDMDKTLIFFNGRLLRAAVAADDEEGWVEILDIAAMAPCDLNKSKTFDTNNEVTPWEAFKTIRKYGKVEFKKT